MSLLPFMSPVGETQKRVGECSHSFIIRFAWSSVAARAKSGKKDAGEIRG